MRHDDLSEKEYEDPDSDAGRRAQKGGCLLCGCICMIVLAIVLPLFTAVLGMLIPGSTQVKIFGGIIISVVAAAGGSPFIACGMLPCICGAMHGVTPPYCACVYTGMGIADAELGPTLKNCMVWIALHYVLSIIVMMGWLPLIGMIS